MTKKNDEKTLGSCGSDRSPVEATESHPSIFADSPTPGPWEVDGYYIRTLDGSPVASVSHDQQGLRRGHERSEANARLIAIAPDLLVSVKECRDAAAAAMRVIADLDVGHLIGASAETREQRFVDELSFAGVKNGFGKRADAVIAKAEGR